MVLSVKVPPSTALGVGGSRRSGCGSCERNAGFPAHASSMEELLEKVDQALYEAKRAGKNVVKLFQADTQS